MKDDVGRTEETAQASPEVIELRPEHRWQARCFVLERELHGLKLALLDAREAEFKRQLQDEYGLTGPAQLNVDAGILVPAPSNPKTQD